MICWWCENEIDPKEKDKKLRMVYERGDPMHHCCRDAYIRTRELEQQQDIDYDHQAGE